MSFYVLVFDNHVSPVPTALELASALQVLTYNGIRTRNLAPSRDEQRYAGRCLRITESAAAAVEHGLETTRFSLEGPFGRKTAKEFYRNGSVYRLRQSYSKL